MIKAKFILIVQDDDSRLDKYTSNEAIRKSWEAFHRRMRGQFFKQRRYLTLAFPELLSQRSQSFGKESSKNKDQDKGMESAASRCVSKNPETGGKNENKHLINMETKKAGHFENEVGNRHIVEFGCGCGSTILTLLLCNPHVTTTAIDISHSAIAKLEQLLVENKLGMNDNFSYLSFVRIKTIMNFYHFYSSKAKMFKFLQIFFI